MNPVWLQLANEAHSLLEAISSHVGDGYLTDAVVGRERPAFAHYRKSAWGQLADEGALETVDSAGHLRYRLTPAGWLRALELTGQIDSEPVWARAVSLAAALEREAGRRPRALDVTALAASLHLPPGWIYNALASNLLVELLPGAAVRIDFDSRSQAFKIPATFGLTIPTF